MLTIRYQTVKNHLSIVKNFQFIRRVNSAIFFQKLARLLLLLLLSHCASVNVSLLRETDADRSAAENSKELLKLKLSNVGILLKTGTNSKLKEEYGAVMEKLTAEMITSIGRVTAVTAQKDWDEQFRLAVKAVKNSLSEIKLDQMLGNDIVLSKIETKWNSWYMLKAHLTDISFEKEKVDPGGRAEILGDFAPPSPLSLLNSLSPNPNPMSAEMQLLIDMNQPHWKVTTAASISFKMTSTQPGQDEEVILIRNIKNSFSKRYLKEPGKKEIAAASVEGIKYNYEDIIPVMQELFPLTSRISALREEKKYAKIIGGEDLYLHPGRKFDILEKSMIETPLGSRYIYHTVGEIELFQTDKTESWGKISGDREKIRTGMEIRIRPEEKSILRILERFIKSKIGSESENRKKA